MLPEMNESRINGLRVGIHPNVRFLAEVPLLIFVALLHLGISLAAGIFGRIKGRAQGSIDHRALRSIKSRALRIVLTVAGIRSAK